MDIAKLPSIFKALSKTNGTATVRIKLNQVDSVFVKAAPDDDASVLSQEERLIFTLTPTSPDVTMFFHLRPGDRFVIKTKRKTDKDTDGKGIIDCKVTTFRAYEIKPHGEAIAIPEPTAEELMEYTCYGSEDSISQAANTRFLNTLLGEYNHVIEHRITHPLVLVPSVNRNGGGTYPKLGSIYNSIIYEYLGVGNCKVLTAMDIVNFTEENTKGRIFIKAPLRAMYVTVYGEVEQVKDLFENTLANLKIEPIENTYVVRSRNVVGAMCTFDSIFGPKQEYALSVIPIPQAFK